MAKHAGHEPDSIRVGVFTTRERAEHAYAALVDAHFDPAHISVVLGGATDNIDRDIDIGGDAGATLGATAAGVGGLLAGLGLITVPGIGSLLALGPVAAAITGAIAGGAFGGLAGSLIGYGVSEKEALSVQEHLIAGRATLIIRCGDRCGEAEGILRAAGALDTIVE